MKVSMAVTIPSTPKTDTFEVLAAKISTFVPGEAGEVAPICAFAFSSS